MIPVVIDHPPNDVGEFQPQTTLKYFKDTNLTEQTSKTPIS